MLKTYPKAICGNGQLEVTSSVMVILLNDIMKLKISNHMEGEHMTQG
jgi:hypothetical protein